MNPLKLANPIHVTRQAAGLATALTRGTTRVVWSLVHHSPVEKIDSPAPYDDPAAAVPAQRPVARDLPGADIVGREPQAPSEPPVDVVGEALAAEGQEPTGAGLAHEPRGSTRDEEHGDAPLQRAELDELLEETTDD